MVIIEKDFLKRKLNNLININDILYTFIEKGVENYEYKSKEYSGYSKRTFIF